MAEHGSIATDYERLRQSKYLAGRQVRDRLKYRSVEIARYVAVEFLSADAIGGGRDSSKVKSQRKIKIDTRIVISSTRSLQNRRESKIWTMGYPALLPLL